MGKRNFFKKIRGLSALLCVVFLLASCGASAEEASAVSSFALDKDGTVYATAEGVFDEEYYSIEELRSAVDEAVSVYNEAAGEERIRLESCELKNSVAKVSLLYRSCGDYAQFNQISAWNGGLEEAVSSGIIGRDTILRPASADESAKAEPVSSVLTQNGKKAKLLLLDEELLITVPGKILYTSGTVEYRSSSQVMSGDPNGSVYIIYQ